MERLTFEGNFCDIAMCQDVPGGSFCENGTCSQRKVWERLKAYEDTGLEPEEVNSVKLALMGKSVAEVKEFEGVPIDRIRELAQADREGRCVVPLCRVGDTVYTFSQMRDKRILPFIKEYEITSIRVKKRSLLYYHEMDGLLKIFKQSDFGKTVFLTRAAAEAALRRAQE